jgi:hypothetical protein
MDIEELRGSLKILELVYLPSFQAAEVVEVTGHGIMCLENRSEEFIDPFSMDFSKCRAYSGEYAIGKLEYNFKLDNEFIIPLLEQLRSIELPLLPTLLPPGFDGASYRLFIGSEFSHQVRYRWWEDPPREWEPLASISNALLNYVRAERAKTYKDLS